MATKNVSRENEKFIRQAVASGEFADRDELVDAAVALMRRRSALVAYVEKGTKQLREGKFTEYNEIELKQLQNRIKTEGRQRRNRKGKR